MNTRKLVTLGLTLALALGVAEANAAQTATMPAGTATSAPMAKVGTTPASTAKVGDAKIGTKTGTKLGTAKLTSGRSVATPVSASRKMVRAPHRSHLSLVRMKRLHRAHLVRVLARTHVAHAGRKVSAKHA